MSEQDAITGYADGGDLLSTSNRVRQEELRIGQHLREVRDDELYTEDGHSTFEEFCEKEIGMPLLTAERMIIAAQADEASLN